MQHRHEVATYHQPNGTALGHKQKNTKQRPEPTGSVAKGQHKYNDLMSQSLSKLYVHMVFHTKYNQDLIKADVENELYAYLGGILKENKSLPIAINGIENHVHVLCIMSKNIALADLLEELKRNSSRWIKTKGTHYADFAWQGGYGGFSVSQSKVDVVRKYIENQKEHHKTETFKEEYIRFLKEYGIDYNEDYLWT